MNSLPYRPKYFKPYELVSPDLYFYFKNEQKDSDLVYLMFDINLLKAMDWLRERYGPATANNWYKPYYDTLSTKEAMILVDQSIKENPHIRYNSGLRTSSSSYYSSGSMHSCGGAVDMILSRISAKDVREDLRQYEKAGNLVPYIKRIEDNVSWLHIDTKDIGLDKIYYFKP